MTDSAKPHIKQGDIIRADQGAYSDYGVMGYFRARKDFAPAVKLEEYLTESPEERSDYEFRPYGFLGWLAARGLIEEHDPVEHFWYLGDYGRADMVRFGHD